MLEEIGQRADLPDRSQGAAATAAGAARGAVNSLFLSKRMVLRDECVREIDPQYLRK
jgi:hypothetical protein